MYLISLSHLGLKVIVIGSQIQRPRRANLDQYWRELLSKIYHFYINGHLVSKSLRHLDGMRKFEIKSAIKTRNCFRKFCDELERAKDVFRIHWIFAIENGPAERSIRLQDGYLTCSIAQTVGSKWHWTCYKVFYWHSTFFWQHNYWRNLACNKRAYHWSTVNRSDYLLCRVAGGLWLRLVVSEI